MGQLGQKAGERAACVKREWRDVVWTAKALGMYRTEVMFVTAGGANYSGFTVFCLSSAVYSCGGGREGDDRGGQEMAMPELGHDGEGTEPVPRMLEALTETKVIGVSAGSAHTEASHSVVRRRWGHGGTQNELVPRLVEALAGKKVVGAATGNTHTAVWTDVGELFTFGFGSHGQLGHRGEADEDVPRLIESLVGA